MADTQSRQCPGCGNARGRSVGFKNGFEILTCAGCRTLFTSKVPEAEEREDYDNYYSEANLNVPEFIEHRLREIVTEFESFRQTNHFLDIGFGAGTLLDVAADAGWRVSGLEVSRPAVEQARARGFDVFQGFIKEANFPSEKFDVVTASEILEHLDSPQDDLVEIARILRKGGLFWATTPSATGISSRLLGLDWSVMAPPEHTQLYSVRGVEQMFQKAGLKVIAVRTHGTNPYEIFEYYRKERPSGAPFDRVGAGYSLNENLSKSRPRTLVKRAINFVLDAARLGDSLKIFAIKS